MLLWFLCYVDGEPSTEWSMLCDVLVLWNVGLRRKDILTGICTPRSHLEDVHIYDRWLNRMHISGAIFGFEQNIERARHSSSFS